MQDLLKKRLELLKEFIELINEQNVKYYIDGDILINIYNNIPLKNNISFNVCLVDKKIKDIKKFNNDKKILKELYDDQGNIYYRYIDKTSLFIDCNDKDDIYEKGIYIKIYLNSKDYKGYTETKVSNINIKYPKDLDLYLKEKYGLGYRYLNEKPEYLSNSIIWSERISYNEYYEILKENGKDLNFDIFKKLKEKENQEKDLKKITQKYRNIVARTDARFKLLKIYENKKENIIKLYQQKNYKKLAVELNEYLFQIKKYYDLDLGLCFDKDIFDITIDYLKNNDDVELAKWLLKNTPKEHLINIDFSYEGKVKNSQIRDLQISFTKMLKKFDDFCRENKITYYLDGGSILGAVRNEGFLPWDDDVDVVLTYDNWKKLVKSLNEKGIEGTKFVCIENNSNHTLYTGKLYDTSSTKVYYSYSLLDSTYGFHLDIIIMDHYFDMKYLKNIHNKLFHLYGQLLNPNELRYNVDITNIYKFCNFIIKIIGRKAFLKILRVILFNNKYKKSKYYRIRWQKFYKHKKELFEKQLYIPFEDITLPIPSGYKEYLETVFGESWFVILLQEDRMPSKRIFNLYVPYNMYQDDYMQFIDKDKTNKAYEKLKLMKMKKVDLIKKTDREKIYYQFYKDKLNIEQKTDLKKVDTFFKKNEFGKIRNYLNDYYYTQLKGSLRDKNLLLISDKNFLYEAIYTLIMTGEFYDARKILNIKKVKDILHQEYKDLMQLMDECKNIDDFSELKIKDLFKKYPYCITFFVKYYDFIKDEKIKEKEADKFMKLYPEKGECEYIKGLYMIENKNEKEGLELIKKAVNNTRNGLLILKMNKLIKEKQNS